MHNERLKKNQEVCVLYELVESRRDHSRAQQRVVKFHFIVERMNKRAIKMWKLEREIRTRATVVVVATALVC